MPADPPPLSDEDKLRLVLKGIFGAIQDHQVSISIMRDELALIKERIGLTAGADGRKHGILARDDLSALDASLNRSEASLDHLLRLLLDWLAADDERG